MSLLASPNADQKTKDLILTIHPYPINSGAIATLGPTGISSEAAGKHLLTAVGFPEDTRFVELYPSYEAALDAVIKGDAVRLLVANAYHGINKFYMDLRLDLERAFVFDTPDYGLAALRGVPIPLMCQVTTHPAPRDLVTQLIPPSYVIKETHLASSTSAAAQRVTTGKADLALTTQPAADIYGLQFISPTRPIRMLWSVFTLKTTLKSDKC